MEQKNIKDISMNTIFQKEIEEEYEKINMKWLLFHFRISFYSVILVFLLECLLGLLMYYTGEISATIPVYLIKFLIIPSISNGLFILVEYKVIHCNSFSQKVKIFTVSLIYIAICFTVFTVHGGLSALFIIFAIPILLTAIYGDYVLCSVTAILSLTSLVVSELFIQWDVDKVSVLADGIRLGNFITSLFVLLAFFAVSLVIIYFERKKNDATLSQELERQKLRHKIQIDDLTGLYNRIAFRNAIRDMQEDTSGANYIFVMVDIDNFKLLNDTLGHIAGDNCLVELSGIMQNFCVDSDSFRYGGDEFCILFKNKTLNQVLEVCDKIRQEFLLKFKEFKTIKPVSVSFGVSCYEKGSVPTTVIQNSDKALYESKKVKNKISVG